MKVEEFELRRVRLPMTAPWRTAFGIETSIPTILVRVRADGYEGWGEASPLAKPTYSAECAATCYALLEQFFLPALVGKIINHPSEVLDRLAMFRGNPFAKSAVETAVWDLEAHRQKKPLWQLLGGSQRKLDAGADFGIQEDINVLLGQVQAAVGRGHKRIKLKVTHGHDVEVVSAVRKTFPKLTFHVDCNSCYSLKDDFAVIKEMDKYDLAMFEQPLNHMDLLDHAELQKKIATPICLDESVKSPRDFEQALRIKACRIINVKIGRVGGMTNALAIEKMAREAGIPAWVGGMHESAIGESMCVELASLPGFTYPGDLFPSDRFYAEDLAEKDLVLDANCQFTPSSDPGTSYKPHLERIERLTEQKVTIRA